MKKIVKVRHLKLGEGKPKICVPIVGKTNEDLIKEAEYLKNIQSDLVEWRVDYYTDVENVEKVKEILGSIRDILGDLPILFTFRSLKEGGEKEVSTEYYVKLNKGICETNMVDLVDIELFKGDKVVADIVSYAHSKNIAVVMSNHDFHKTPSKEEIINRLCKMQELNADLPKIAVMPQNTEDVLTLLSATNEMAKENSKTPIITISMSGIGVISRLAGEIFGSAVTFGSAKEASAPGQISVIKLNDALNIIHESK